jgi:ferric hydroxamate transport system substrate-binding protein
MQENTILLYRTILVVLIIASSISISSIVTAFAQTPSMNNNNSSSATTNGTETAITNQQQLQSSNSSSSSSTDQPRVINHAMGSTEIVGTPEKIVALDWSASEILLAIGVQPVAVADLEGMKQYLRPEGLSPDIVDVGTIEEPNLEMITQLNPDLIFAQTSLQSGLYEILSSIAPTVMYENLVPLNSSRTHLEALEQNIILVADAANKRDIGVEIVDQLHAKYDEAAQKIAAAGLNGTRFVFGAVDPPYGEYTTSTLRFFDNTFFTPQMLSKLGLENAVTEIYGGLANGEGGQRQVGLEGLSTIDGPDVHFFYIHAEGQDAFQNEWEGNPVWTNLEIARNGHIHPLGPMYVFGGPKQMEEMVDKVVIALTGVAVEQQQPITANQTSAMS